MIGFVIGNGLSRAGYDLTRRDGHGTTLGCNGIYNDYQPDYVIGVDVGIKAQIHEAIESGYPRKWKFVTREFDVNTIVWITCDGEKIKKRCHVNGGLNNNSGVLAAAYAVEILGVTECYLLGMDFFRPTPSGVNDIYGGYHPGGSALMQCWNYMTKNNPQTRFVRVGEIHERDASAYKTLDGIKFIGYDEFLH